MVEMKLTEDALRDIAKAHAKYSGEPVTVKRADGSSFTVEPRVS